MTAENSGRLTLEGRKKLTLTGAKEVLRFDEELAELDTALREKKSLEASIAAMEAEQAELGEKEALFGALAQRFCNYMQNGAPDFDVWHNTQCEFFITEFSKILKEAHKNPADATYGKAQKIVNMTFKYLYCFDDAKASPV